MKKLTLSGSNGISEILIDEKIINNVADMCLDVFSPSRVHIVTDTNVAPLYLENIEKQFSIPVTHSILPAGEEYKRLETINTIYTDLINADITRKDLIIALGGGVIGDMTGFAAATFLRGVSLCQIPTTLLAQVDSSVGGKTAVDMPQGKNLVGAFYQPRLVLIDPYVLKSLPEDIFIDGMAEVVKYGCIQNADILDMVSKPDYKNNISDIIYECVKIKRDVVEVDEHDTGLRMILNFGHTIGHAIEKLGDYTKFSHGNAVSMGMVAAMKLSDTMGNDNSLTSYLSGILNNIGLPTSLPYEKEDIFNALLSDKKKMGNTMNFILVRTMGKAEIEKIEIDSKECYYDDKGKIYRIENELLPDQKYEINGYTYETDDKGRIVSVEGQLHMKEREGRLPIKDSIEDIGKGDEHEGDDRGHLIGDQFDGSNGLENMIPQNSEINRRDFKNFENELANKVREGKEVEVIIEPVYDGDSRRPSAIVVSYKIDGAKEIRIFPND